MDELARINFTEEDWEYIRSLQYNISLKWLEISIAMDKALIPFEIKNQIKQVSKSLQYNETDI